MSNGLPGTPFPFLSAGGEVADLIARFDWAATEVGPLDAWPRHMTAALSAILRSPVPIATLWGESGVLIYNDPYACFSGARHPGL
ncbi:hypothetical protein, partial [Escherichia coli]|uniref:hypothetical protein n=1 Tax=Escherichia coli TaxID=562 RepID=UPI00192A5B69